MIPGIDVSSLAEISALYEACPDEAIEVLSAAATQAMRVPLASDDAEVSPEDWTLVRDPAREPWLGVAASGADDAVDDNGDTAIRIHPVANDLGRRIRLAYAHLETIMERVSTFSIALAALHDRIADLVDNDDLRREPWLSVHSEVQTLASRVDTDILSYVRDNQCELAMAATTQVNGASVSVMDLARMFTISLSDMNNICNTRLVSI